MVISRLCTSTQRGHHQIGAVYNIGNSLLSTIIKSPPTANTTNNNTNHNNVAFHRRCYVSRAHQRKTPEPSYAIADALEEVLAGVSDRREKRAARWERNRDKRVLTGIKVDGPYRNTNETIELVLNLNLDLRKPGQSIRGSLPLPHGTGKRQSIAVFTSDPSTATASTAAGATLTGGTDLIESILAGDTPVNFDRALATPEMMPSLSKIARILGPKGLMPNAKVGTIQDVGEDMVEAVGRQVEGMLQYRAEKNGIVHLGVGKGDFEYEELLDNIKTVLDELQEVKPEKFGKGKSGGSKVAKYFLKAFLTATQGKSVNLDMRTVDPTSTFYMETELP